MNAIILALVAPATAAIAQATDPAMGTWVLNVAKSKYESGPPLRSQTRTYTAVPNGYRFIADATNAAGEKAHSDFTAVFNNRFQAITGNTSADSLMITRVDAWTVETVQKKASTIVTISVRTISKDGKTLTNTSMGVTNDGKRYANVEVFDRK
jgi:hypothetical protein